VQETDDEQDAKQIVEVENGPGEQKPADKNELKVRPLLQLSGGSLPLPAPGAAARR
jgi:hypothetical protein